MRGADLAAVFSAGAEGVAGAGAVGVAVGTHDSLATAGAAVGSGLDVFQNCHELPAQPPNAITIVSEATASIEDLVPRIGTSTGGMSDSRGAGAAPKRRSNPPDGARRRGYGACRMPGEVEIQPRKSRSYGAVGVTPRHSPDARVSGRQQAPRLADAVEVERGTREQ